MDEAKYAVTLTADEREFILRALQLIAHETEHPTARTTIESAKVKRATARKPGPPVETFAPNTGDPAVDEFMRRKHDPNWQAALKKSMASRPNMTPMPRPAPGIVQAPWRQQDRAAAYREHDVIQHSS